MVYVVIPVHNRKKTTLNCLRYLSQQIYQDMNIVIVDDGSKDGTSKAIAQEYPGITILHGNGSLWWTGAIHLGIEHVLKKCENDDYILSINDDVIVKPEYITILLKTSKTHNDAIVGSLCKDIVDKKTILDAGITVQWKPYGYTQINHEPKQQYVTTIDTISGRGVLIPVSVIKQIGNFDKQHLPHYGADYEFGMRAKAAGYPLVLSNEAVVYLDNSLTGFRPKNNILSYTELWKRLFSIKSPANILVHLKLVWLHSPNRMLKIYNIFYILAGNTFIIAKNIIIYTLIKLGVTYKDVHE